MSVVLVTGASSGFGEAIVVCFANAGHRVVAAMRAPEQAPESLLGLGTQIKVLRLDVTDNDARRSVIAEVVQLEGRLDVLINNAGIAPMASFEDTPSDLLREVFETNYFGASELMRLALPVMRAQGAGRIVNVSAVGAVLTTPLLTAYCASKHALDATSAALDIEARPFGVRVSSVLPGPFVTSIAHKAPKTQTTEPYRAMADHLAKIRALSEPPPSDLRPVVEAVLAAATEPNPAVRYLVPSGLLAQRISAAVHEMEKLHAFEADRAGV